MTQEKEKFEKEGRHFRWEKKHELPYQRAELVQAADT